MLTPNRPSVLVVEDEHALRKLLEWRLSKQYEVRTASNGVDALELVYEKSPDLIISDIMMPRMDGFQFQAALEKDRRFRVIPFIFITTKADEASRLRGLRTGVDDYITKPFDLDQLLIRVNILLNRVQYFKTGYDLNEPSERIRLFLCHAKEDKSEVSALFDKLVDDEADVWFDERSLLPGQNWEHEIRKAIRGSHAVLVCLSNSSTQKRGYVQNEIRVALDIAELEPEGAIFIIPVRLEKCTVPVRLNVTHWVDLFENDGYSRLLKALVHRAKSLNLIPPNLNAT